jgi:ABC-type phosphate transport system substrate-binding protein
MRSIKLLLALLIPGITGAVNSSLPGSAIRIIANPNVEASEVSRDDLNRIFLLTKTALPGAPHLEPVQENAGTTRDLFLREYIGRTNSALMTYYRSLMFTGKASIPRSFGSDADVAAYVAKTKGAIGYVSADVNPTGVKTIKVN